VRISQQHFFYSLGASGESDTEEECGNFACVLIAWVGGVDAGVGSTQHVDTLFVGTNKWAKSGDILKDTG
jgi:hypothetical protein